MSEEIEISKEESETIAALKADYEAAKKSHDELHRQLKQAEEELELLESNPPVEFSEAWADKIITLRNKITALRNSIADSFLNLERSKAAIPQAEKRVIERRENELRQKKQIWSNIQQKQAQKKAAEESQAALEANRQNREAKRVQKELADLQRKLALLKAKEEE